MLQTQAGTEKNKVLGNVSHIAESEHCHPHQQPLTNCKLVCRIIRQYLTWRQWLAPQKCYETAWRADRLSQLEMRCEPAPVEVSCQTPMEQDDSHAPEMWSSRSIYSRLHIQKHVMEKKGNGAFSAWCQWHALWNSVCSFGHRHTRKVWTCWEKCKEIWFYWVKKAIMPH